MESQELLNKIYAIYKEAGEKKDSGEIFANFISYNEPTHLREYFGDEKWFRITKHLQGFTGSRVIPNRMKNFANKNIVSGKTVVELMCNIGCETFQLVDDFGAKFVYALDCLSDTIEFANSVKEATGKDNIEFISCDYFDSPDCIPEGDTAILIEFPIYGTEWYSAMTKACNVKTKEEFEEKMREFTKVLGSKIKENILICFASKYTKGIIKDELKDEWNIRATKLNHTRGQVTSEKLIDGKIIQEIYEQKPDRYLYESTLRMKRKS